MQPSKIWPIATRTFLCLFAAVCLAFLARPFFQGHVAPRPPPIRSYDPGQPAELDKAEVARVEAFCGDCHGLPRPDNYARDAWHDKVLRGYEFYAESGRNDLDPPAPHLSVVYYRNRAPEQPTFRRPAEATTAPKTTFVPEKISLFGQSDIPPAVSHIRWTPLRAGSRPTLVLCDMRRGTVAAIQLNETPAEPRILAKLNHPCHAEPCDLDGDGLQDLVIAELGSFFPDDHDRGKVVWLRGTPPQNVYEEVIISEGLGRVADVRPADLDGDDDQDLVVAEFGASRTGSVLVLRNGIAQDGDRHFQQEEIDPRPGTSHVPVLDLDRDGQLDFVALITQEHETVEAFLNLGDGRFARHPLWAGPDQAFGSSGIEMVDLDGDGDVDILYTNGDTFDDLYIKPCHGIQWLENRGDLSFAHHRIVDMPGAYRAMAGDLDLDGDLDLVATTWLPDNFLPRSARSNDLPSIVLLEQTSKGVFSHHTLERNAPYHAAAEMADFDGDGDLDFAVGIHLLSSKQHVEESVVVWWNQLRTAQN